MKRIIFSLLVILSFIAFNPMLNAATAADKAKTGAACSKEDLCKSCQKTCEDALKYCLSKGGKHAAKEHIDALKDCIAMCKVSAELGARNSSLLPKIREACAEACKKCAASCEALNDPKLKDCVTACNECEKSCSSGTGSCCTDGKESKSGK
jgi:hypothetical protein